MKLRFDVTQEELEIVSSALGVYTKELKEMMASGLAQDEIDELKVDLKRIVLLEKKVIKSLRGES